MAAEEFGKPPEGWRRRLYNVIFEADTKAGRTFDIALVIAILLSILVVVLDSVPSVNAEHNNTMNRLEWGITLLFTLEYVGRLACVRHPLRYATSFFGIIDLLTILPSYFSLFVPEAAALLDIRITNRPRDSARIAEPNCRPSAQARAARAPLRTSARPARSSSRR